MQKVKPKNRWPLIDRFYCFLPTQLSRSCKKCPEISCFQFDWKNNIDFLSRSCNLLPKILPLLEYAAPVWPTSLLSERPWTYPKAKPKEKFIRIIGLPVDALPSLSERREKLPLREIEAIIRDTNHPCHLHLALSHMNMTILLTFLSEWL
jgi:hypothetical protein